MVWSHGAGNHLLSNNEVAVLNEVILLNKRLILNDFNYVRIDWYILGDRIYFGEITFTPGLELEMNLDLSWKNKWLSGGRMNINSCTTLVVFASCMRYFFLIIAFG